MKYPTLDGPGLAAAQIVRVIVRERGTKASETVLKRIGSCADSIGWFRLECVGVCWRVAHFRPEGREFESPRARHSLNLNDLIRVNFTATVWRGNQKVGNSSLPGRATYLSRM
jgi:hypothetical protein